MPFLLYFYSDERQNLRVTPESRDVGQTKYFWNEVQQAFLGTRYYLISVLNGRESASLIQNDLAEAERWARLWRMRHTLPYFVVGSEANM